MPIKSKAQRRKFAELLVEGKITPETFEEWNRGAGSKELPERVKPKSRKATKGKPKTTAKPKSKRKPKPKRGARAKPRPKARKKRAE